MRWRMDITGPTPDWDSQSSCRGVWCHCLEPGAVSEGIPARRATQLTVIRAGNPTYRELARFMQRSSDGLRSKLRAGVGASGSENLNANQTTNQILRCRFLRAEGLALNRNKFLRCLPQDCRGQVPASPGVEDFPIDVDGANFLFRDRCSASDLSIAGGSSSHLRLERLDSDPGDPQGILNVTAHRSRTELQSTTARTGPSSFHSQICR